jgi:hypothetical protein
MKRKIIEAEPINSIEEILAFDKEVRIYHYWMCRPQVKTILKLFNKIRERERERERESTCLFWI